MANCFWCLGWHCWHRVFDKLIVLSFNYAAERRMLHGNLTFNGGTCDNSAGVAPILTSFPRMKTASKIWHFGFEENDIQSASFNHIYQAINSVCCWWYNYSDDFMNESDQTIFLLSLEWKKNLVVRHCFVNEINISNNVTMRKIEMRLW